MKNKPLTIKVRCECGKDVEIQPASLLAKERFKKRGSLKKQLAVMKEGIKKKYKV